MHLLYLFSSRILKIVMLTLMTTDLCKSQTKKFSRVNVISPSSVNMSVLSKQRDDSEVFCSLKKNLKNAPFDMILAVQEKLHSFVSLADIRRKQPILESYI